MNRLTRSVVLSIVSVMSAVSYAQEYDLALYARYANPPTQTDYVGSIEGESPYVQRFVLTQNFPYNNFNTLKIARFNGVTTPDQDGGIVYMEVRENDFAIIGTVFQVELLGKIELKYDVPIVLSRTVTIGQTLEKTSGATTPLGKLDTTVSYKILGVETVETPLGRFENALKVELTKSAAIFGQTLGAEITIEWHHPSVGLVQVQNIATGGIAKITSIDPPVEIPTAVGDWMQY